MPSLTPSTKLQTFLQRLLSTVILLGILGGVVWWGNPWGYAIIICLFCNIATWEWTNMLLDSDEPSQPALLFFAGILQPWILAFAFLTQGMTIGWLTAVLCPAIVAILSFTWEMRKPVVDATPLRKVGSTLIAFMYPGWMFSLIIAYLAIDGSMGLMSAIWIIVITKGTDIFAYVSGVLFGGKLFGNTKMIPHISPKKTWEGFIGSMILTTALGLGLGYWLLGTAPSIIFALTILLIAWWAVIGDLAGSLIKRSLKVKDSGSLLPGIGGVFDLIDSPAFTVPLSLILVFLIQQ